MSQSLKKLAAEVAAQRQQLGLSALAVCRHAGLSMNYVRNVERGLRRPRPPQLHALCRALGVNKWTEARWRRLAGIELDPEEDPETRDTRRRLWRHLAYALANHVLLPRLQLPSFLSSSQRRNRAMADVVTKALGAFDGAAFVKAVAADTCPPALGRMIEKHFPGIDAGCLRVFEGRLMDASAERERSALHVLLTSSELVEADVSVPLDYDAFLAYGFDRCFAICFFPLLYWHACRYLPFFKVALPLGRRSMKQQLVLHEAVRSGMSIVELDEALLGRGPIGESISASRAVRPHHDLIDAGEDATVSFSWYAPELDEDLCVTGPVPPTDLVFDHLDRSEFLSRFPLVKLAPDSSTLLARKQALGSRQAWVDYVLRYCDQQIPPQAAIHGPDVFFDALNLEWWSIAPDESPTVAELGQACRAALEAFARAKNWKAIAHVARLLDLSPAWQRFAEAFAKIADRPGGNRQSDEGG